MPIEPVAIKPNTEDMREHLVHLFGGDLGKFGGGLIEIAHTTLGAGGKPVPRQARLYDLDQIDAAVGQAFLMSSRGNNVYVGAQLRVPGTPLSARASDKHALCLTSAYIDLDDEPSARGAKLMWGETRPSLIVVTGREPGLRAQMWWRLDEPSDDQERNLRLLATMASKFGGDPSVASRGRLMRLAGSIAHPDPTKQGRVKEMTYIHRGAIL